MGNVWQTETLLNAQRRFASSNILLAPTLPIQGFWHAGEAHCDIGVGIEDQLLVWRGYLGDPPGDGTVFRRFRAAAVGPEGLTDPYEAVSQPSHDRGGNCDSLGGEVGRDVASYCAKKSVFIAGEHVDD